MGRAMAQKAAKARDRPRVRKLTRCRVRQLPWAKKSEGQQGKGPTAITRMCPCGPGFPTLHLSLDFPNPGIPYEGRQRAVGIGRTILITLGDRKAGTWGQSPADSVCVPAKVERGPTQTDPLSAPRASRFASDGKCGMLQPFRSKRKERVEGRR